MLKFRPVLQLTRSMISLSYEWRGDCDPPRRLAPIPRKTMLNIEKNSDGHKTTIRLIGRMQAEHLPALQARRSAINWIEELDSIDGQSEDSMPNWRQATVAASALLSASHCRKVSRPNYEALENWSNGGRT